MNILVQTNFFRAISQDEAYDIENAYTEFALKIMELCYNTSEITYCDLVFTLSNTEIELYAIQEGYIHSSSMLTLTYIGKAIRLIETAKQLVDKY